MADNNGELRRSARLQSLGTGAAPGLLRNARPRRSRQVRALTMAAPAVRRTRQMPTVTYRLNYLRTLMPPLLQWAPALIALASRARGQRIPERTTILHQRTVDMDDTEVSSDAQDVEPDDLEDIDDVEIMEPVIRRSRRIAVVEFKRNNQKEKQKAHELATRKTDTDEIDEEERKLGRQVLRCPICFEDTLGPELRLAATECGHMFCEPCITRATAENGGSCPICRKRLVEEFRYPLITLSDTYNN